MNSVNVVKYDEQGLFLAGKEVVSCKRCGALVIKDWKKIQSHDDFHLTVIGSRS